MKGQRAMFGKHRWKAFVLACGMAWPSWAEPLPLETTPAGASGAPPNLILSVGDSASLGPGGLQALRGVLRSIFSADAVSDDALRLAYQSYGRCRAQADGSCAKRLQLRSLDSTERARFFQWLDSLVPSRSNSAHVLFSEAGRFMRSTGVEGPMPPSPAWRRHRSGPVAGPTTCTSTRAGGAMRPWLARMRPMPALPTASAGCCPMARCLTPMARPRR